MRIHLLPMIPDFIILACLYYFILFPKWKQVTKQRLFWHTALYAYICIILMLTLLPVLGRLPNILYGFRSQINWNPFIDWQLQRGEYLLESVLNIALFIPFGFLIQKALKLTPLSAIVIGMLFSICIEILQPLISFDRIGDISDMITNTFGTCIGVFLHHFFCRH